MTAQEHDAKELIRFAMDAVQSAGDRALQYYGKGNSEVKFDEELVTEAELNLSEFFRGQLRSHFPDHRIFGEETMAAGYTLASGSWRQRSTPQRAIGCSGDLTRVASACRRVAETPTSDAIRSCSSLNRP